MEVLIEQLEKKIEEGSINYDSLTALINIIEEMVETNADRFSVIERKIIAKLIEIMKSNDDISLLSPKLNESMNFFKKRNARVMVNVEYEGLVEAIIKEAQSGSYDTANIVYLLLMFKKSLDRITSFTKIGANEAYDINDCLDIIQENINVEVTPEIQDTKLKRTFLFKFIKSNKKACKN